MGGKNLKIALPFTVTKSVTSEEMPKAVAARDANRAFEKFSGNRNHGFSIYEPLIADTTVQRPDRA